MKRKILLALGVVVAALVLFYFEWISYGWGQLNGQVEVLWNAEPIDEFLASHDLSVEEYEKIEMILDVRRYATDVLGLNPSGSYTKIYDQKGEPILWVVEACPPFELKPHKWDYPFLGELGYKGFFDYKKAEAESSRLARQGLDVDIREVSAWSTLGWFDDPVLSNMLKRSKAGLAELLIHELTHGTVYIKSDDELNENLATLVGRYGAIRYLSDRFGDTSNVVLDYQSKLERRKASRDYLLSAAQDLRTFYDSLRAEPLDHSEKTRLKRDKIDDIVAAVEHATGYHADGQINNTFFTGYLQYNGSLDSLEQVFIREYRADVKVFLDHFAASDLNASK